MLASEISAIVIAACTFIYTIGTLLLWNSTRKTIALLKEQVEIQNAASKSTAWHKLIDSHRDLYLEIIANDKLLKLFSKEIHLDPHEVRRKYLATLMINHALRIYLDYQNKLNIPEDLKGYVNDLHSMLQFRFVQKRWDEIKGFYPDAFKDFFDQVKDFPVSKTSI